MSYFWKVIKNYNGVNELRTGSIHDIVRDAKECNKNPENTFLELLNVVGNGRKEQVPYRLYMDIDGIETEDTKKVTTFINQLMVEFYRFLVRVGIIDKRCEDMIKSFKEQTKTTVNENSNTHKGISLHIIFPLIVQDTEPRAIKTFIKFFKTKFYKRLNKKGYTILKDWVKCIDTNVYSRNRLFRGIFSCQPGMIRRGEVIERDLNSYHRPCLIIDYTDIIDIDHYDYRDYIIQYIDKVNELSDKHFDMETLKCYGIRDKFTDDIMREYDKIFNIYRALGSQPIEPEDEKDEKQEEKQEPLTIETEEFSLSVRSESSESKHKEVYNNENWIEDENLLNVLKSSCSYKDKKSKENKPKEDKKYTKPKETELKSVLIDILKDIKENDDKKEKEILKMEIMKIKFLIVILAIIIFIQFLYNLIDYLVN